MIIVTGGAGFIGSVLVSELNRRGRDDIIVVDSIYHDEQEHNIAPLRYEKLMSGNEFRTKLKDGFFAKNEIEVIFHLGAITSTVESDWDKIVDVNIDFSQELIRACVDNDVRCIYVSSGATYGMGEFGYSDEHDLFDKITPLNLYGKSKLKVDIWARDTGYLKKIVGLRYFNVFGPNEWHKEGMRSVIAKKYDQLLSEGLIELFKSNSSEYKDGEQMRDFIYVFDAVKATLFFMDNPDIGGIFNIGTGVARNWNDVAKAMFSAVNKEINLKYVPLPDNLKNQYQNFTQADISKLRQVGFKDEFMTLEDSVNDYIRNYLEPHSHVGSY